MHRRRKAPTPRSITGRSTLVIAASFVVSFALAVAATAALRGGSGNPTAVTVPTTTVRSPAPAASVRINEPAGDSLVKLWRAVRPWTVTFAATRPGPDALASAVVRDGQSAESAGVAGDDPFVSALGGRGPRAVRRLLAMHGEDGQSSALSQLAWSAQDAAALLGAAMAKCLKPEGIYPRTAQRLLSVAPDIGLGALHPARPQANSTATVGNTTVVRQVGYLGRNTRRVAIAIIAATESPQAKSTRAKVLATVATWIRLHVHASRPDATC